MELSKLNRDNIAKKIGHRAVLLHGGNTVYRNNDVAYDFRQDSNFHYLTEWPEPSAHAIIIVQDNKAALYLFVVALFVSSAYKTKYLLPLQVHLYCLYKIEQFV